MSKMRWTWEELHATPPYVARFVYDFLVLISRQEQEQIDKAEAKNKGG